jgi:hypothetical protein
MTAFEKGRHGPVAPVASLVGIRSEATIPSAQPRQEHFRHAPPHRQQAGFGIRSDVTFDGLQQQEIRYFSSTWREHSSILRGLTNQLLYLLSYASQTQALLRTCRL